MLAKSLKQQLEAFLTECPIVGIFRGVRPDEVIDIAEAAWESGLRIIEVPLNSPDPFESIYKLRNHFGDRMIVGGGTILSPDEARALAAAGGQISVSPNCRPEVITAAIECNMVPMPGIATPTEAFEAVGAGAEYLKLFPAGQTGPSLVKSLQDVLPRGIAMLAVGGVSPSNALDFVKAGCRGLGIGSGIYRPGYSAQNVAEKSDIFVDALHKAAIKEPAKTRPPEVTCLVRSQNQIGDSPVWDVTRQSLIWLDTMNQNIHCFEPEGELHRHQSLSDPVFAIGQRSDGTFWGISSDAACTVDVDTGTVEKTSEPAPLPENTRLNNAAIDDRGRIWAGSLDRAARPGMGSLYRFDENGSVETLASGLGICNGIGWSPDGSEVFYVDTLQRALIAFRNDHDTIVSPRLVYDFLGVAGKPHSLLVNAEGHLWVAMWGGEGLIRISSSGTVLETIKIPSENVSACAFAAENTGMFVTTSRFRVTDEAISKYPDSGSVFYVDRR